MGRPGAAARMSMHPRDALFGAGEAPPALPVCDHYAGVEVRMRKSLELQAELGPVFDVTLDAEDGAPVGGEAEHAALIAELLTGPHNRFGRVGARLPSVDQDAFETVAQTIVDKQTDFLEYGPEHIRPLKMEDVSQVVGVHVTTVSRAVADKYIATPRGIFSLKRFFGGGTTTESGEEVAWDIIRIKLQELVDKEDKKNPYSDDELVEKLKDQGLHVARRTITKYRQKMGIPSSRQRRDWSAE